MNGKNGRSTGGRFGPGNPGRPKGALNRTTLAVQDLLDGEAERITRAAIDAALAGDPAAMRLCLERLLPPRKGRPVAFDLGDTSTPEARQNALASILEAVAGGEISPDEASGLIRVFHDAIEADKVSVELEKTRGNLVPMADVTESFVEIKESFVQWVEADAFGLARQFNVDGPALKAALKNTVNQYLIEQGK